MFKLLMFLFVSCIILGGFWQSNICLKPRRIVIIAVSIFIIFFIIPEIVRCIDYYKLTESVTEIEKKNITESLTNEEISTESEILQNDTNAIGEEATKDIKLPENLNLKNYYTLKYGELLDVKEFDNKLIIKAKITPNLTNDSTIKQNYYNIEDLVKNQRIDNYDSLDYWAVADMTNGEEVKVISFTVYASILDLIKEDAITAYDLGDYVDDLYIHQSLR